MTHYLDKELPLCASEAFAEFFHQVGASDLDADNKSAVLAASAGYNRAKRVAPKVEVLSGMADRSNFEFDEPSPGISSRDG
jgi:hypothetical protein